MSTYTPEQIKDIATALYGWTALPRILPSAPGTGPDWDLGADIRAVLSALEAVQKDRDYEREQKQYYVGVGAELRLKLTEAQHEITRDIHDIAYTDKSLDRAEKALAYARTDNADLKERVEGAKNGIKTLVDQRERLTTRVEALTAYASALEKAGDGIRNYKPDSNPLQAETDIEDLFDAWDAARKAKP